MTFLAGFGFGLFFGALAGLAALHIIAIRKWGRPSADHVEPAPQKQIVIETHRDMRSLLIDLFDDDDGWDDDEPRRIH